MSLLRQKRRPQTLSSLITLYVGGAMLVLIALLALALQQSVHQLLHGALREKADALAGQLATVTLDAALIRDYGTIERYVADLVGRQDLLFIEIRRNDGEILGRAGERVHDEPMVTRPIQLLREHLGDVVVQYDTRRLAALAYQITAGAALVIVVLIAVLFLALRRLLQRSVIAPIRELAAKVDPAQAAPIAPGTNAPRELAELAETFNALQENIRGHIQQLEQAHQAHNDAIRRLCGEQRLATVGQMAAELAHEMNTPLSNILGYAQTALARTNDEELRRRLQVISEHARRLQRIVRDMLSAVRPPVPQGQSLDLGEILASITRLIEPIVRKHDARIEIVAPAGHGSAWADVSMIEQILFNLISNALQAGARLIRLVVDPPNSDRACLFVEDDGNGIPEALKERIFEPFVSSKAAGLGTGLGLAISQRLAREMDGTLTLVASGSGHTVFRLCVPRRAIAGSSVAS
jgi:signal transduction histidine kinase